MLAIEQGYFHSDSFVRLHSICGKINGWKKVLTAYIFSSINFLTPFTFLIYLEDNVNSKGNSGRQNSVIIEYDNEGILANQRC